MSSECPPTPRLSFSQCLIQPESDNPPQKPVDSPDSDFDFKVSESRYASSADELFSDGKILPIPLKNLNPDPNPDPITVPVSKKNGGKKSLWMFGRSASLNCGGSGMMQIKFLRSYSTGSDPNANPNPMNPKPKPKPRPQPQRKNLKNKGVCGNGGNRMSPVPLFPKERGFIGFLLCSCVGGGNNRSMECY